MAFRQWLCRLINSINYAQVYYSNTKTWAQYEYEYENKYGYEYPYKDYYEYSQWIHPSRMRNIAFGICAISGNNFRVDESSWESNINRHLSVCTTRGVWHCWGYRVSIWWFGWLMMIWAQFQYDIHFIKSQKAALNAGRELNWVGMEWVGMSWNELKWVEMGALHVSR